MWVSYSDIMRDAAARITVRIDVEQPIELADFVGVFVALGNQFEKFIHLHRPELDGKARVYIKDVRDGSIIAYIVPIIQCALGCMDAAIIVEDFVTRYGGRISKYFMRGGRDESATKSDLKDFMSAVTAIANDPNGSCQLSAVSIEIEGPKTKAEITFNTEQARIAQGEIEEQRRSLDKVSAADYQNVLMVFCQSNLKDTERSGEKVVIESLSKKPLPLIYCSDLAMQRVKSEIKHGDRNIFKLGFLVDVNLEMLHGKGVAYRLMRVLDVIELPDD